MKTPTLGAVAYEAYCQDFVTLPYAWEQLPPGFQAAYERAAQAVLEHARRQAVCPGKEDACPDAR